MLNNNKIRPRNFANQPFFSSNSIFHRDSPFHDSSLRNRDRQPYPLASFFFSVQRIKRGEKYLYKTIRYPVLFIRGRGRVYLNR